MTFTTLLYPLFLIIVAILYYLSPKKWRVEYLLIISYLFYGIYNWKLIPMLVVFTVFIYLAAIVLAEHKKKVVLGIIIVLSISPLFVCKYLNFILEIIDFISQNILTNSVDLRVSIVLPMGISYFTFKSIGYLADVYKGKIQPERNICNLAVFISFFPEMLIGPIDRTYNLLKQLQTGERKLCLNNIKYGILLLLWGYFEKLVVADRIALIVNQVYSDLYSYEGLQVAIAAMLYSLQIYFDFAGCTYMVIGTGKILGFSLPENFRQPYLAISVEDFWRRWHISLTSWLRDYIYIPLGGNRKGIIRKYINIMIVFLVSGIWHGAGVGFVIWGALNGAFQIIGNLLRKYKKIVYAKLYIDEKSIICIWWKRIWTFILMTFAWVFFRAADLSQAMLIFERIFAKWNPWILFDDSLYNLGLSTKNFHVMILLICIVLVFDLLHERKVKILEWVKNQHFITKCLLVYGLMFAIIIFGIYGTAYDASSFIYMQF